jgi:MoaA/NifB/PqqE/SkfB family radical SAM enzyme
VREYGDTIGQRMPVAECLAAADECGAPVVSVCGGEPLLYPDIEELLRGLLARRKHVYLCTNGLLLARKIAMLPRSPRLFINVHLDGMEATHDRLVGQQGAFAAVVEGIQAAAAAGLRITTNTTIYHDTDMDEVAVLWEYLGELGVGDFMVSPAYAYEAVVRPKGTVPFSPVRDGQADENWDSPREQPPDPAAAERMFMTRGQVREKFRRARPMLARFRLVASPLYLEFLCGQRELTCAAWASPTRNVRGWRGPCYLIADAHYPTYRELLQATDWQRLGPDSDQRCRDCLVHCGFEPAAVLAAQGRLRDMLKMAVWQMT